MPDKKYIIWVSNSSTDPERINRATDLKTVLNDPLEWDEILFDTSGDAQNLENTINGLNIGPNDDYLIYIHDYGQLVNGVPTIFSTGKQMLLNIIDNKFHDKNYLHLTVVMTGKNSGVGQMNYGQLITGENPFTLGTSMSASEKYELDAFDLAYQLPGPQSTWSDLKQAIEREIGLVGNLPDPVKQHGFFHHHHP